MSRKKANGKAPLPPSIADVLTAANEKMTEGMKLAEFAQPRMLQWSPQEDITVHELARALIVLLVAFSGGNAFDILGQQAPEVQRHFSDASADGPA